MDPPTRTIVTEDGQLTSDRKLIHSEFKIPWSREVFCKDRPKQSWKEFKVKHGEYIPHKPYTDGLPTGEDLAKAAKKMGKTVPGMVGWRSHELKYFHSTLGTKEPA